MLQSLFSTLLNMSLTASIVIAAVLALRLLFRKAPRAISYALWAVVLFRLLCPVSLPSAASLFSLLDAPARETGALTSRIEYVPETLQRPALVPTELPDAPISSDAAPEAEPLTLEDALPWIWLAGAAAMVLWALAGLGRLRRKLRTASPLGERVYLADGIATPFVLGLFRPRIYLPSSLEPREREYILLHERLHIRRLDHLFKLLAYGALCLHWFNPLVWVAFLLAGRDMEVCCDEAVIRTLGPDIRADYAASLLTLAVGHPVFGATPLAFGAGDPKGRIRHLARLRRPALWAVLAAILLCAVVAVALLTNPAQKTAAGAWTGAEKWLDGLEDGMDWDGQQEISLDAFPGVTFRWTPEQVEAVTEDETISLYTGMPVWSVYFAELSGDGLPELCSTVSMGSGVIDNRVVVYDYAKGVVYTIVERGENDYTLSLEDGVLLVTKTDYDTGAVVDRGPLVFEDETVMVRWENAPSSFATDLTYVSYQCLYRAAASSALDPGGDSGCLYVAAPDSFTIYDRNSQGTSDDVDTAGGMAVLADIPVDQWSWQPFPYTQAEWAALFPDGASELAQLPAQAASLYYQPLNDQWFLLQVEGDPWLCEMRDGQLWSMYSLVAASAMGVAQWEYAPALSSRSPFFPLLLDLSFTEGTASCEGGALMVRDRSETAVSLTSGDGLYWSPLDADGTQADRAVIRFTLSDGAGLVYAGTVYLTASGGTDGRQVYTASLVGTGLHLSANTQGEGGILAAADGAETVFFAQFGGNTSFQQKLVLTEDAPRWSITVQNTGDASILMELEGTVYRIEAGRSETIGAEGPWTPGTYMVGFSGAGISRMEGSVRAVRTAAPGAAETTAQVFYDLGNGPLVCTAADLSRYIFYTNTTEIAVALEGTDVTGSLTLLDISQGSEGILFGRTDPANPACSFSNLTASRLYQLAWDGPADCLFTVSDG